MTFLVAAVGATVAALIELTVTPYIRAGGAHPHPVFVLGVVWTIAVGLEGGLAWAFIGGLALDALAQRPLGSTAFALLVALAGVWVLARLLVRFRPLVPIIAAFVFSVVYSVTLFVLFGALREPIPVQDPVAVLVPGAIYDAVIAAAIGPLAVTLHDRRMDQERVDW